MNPPDYQCALEEIERLKQELELEEQGGSLWHKQYVEVCTKVNELTQEKEDLKSQLLMATATNTGRKSRDELLAQQKADLFDAIFQVQIAGFPHDEEGTVWVNIGDADELKRICRAWFDAGWQAHLTGVGVGYGLCSISFLGENDDAKLSGSVD